MRVPERLWSRIEMADGCWMWTGSRTRNGYGKVDIGRSSQVAHRAVYTAVVGTIPLGMQLDHLCRNRRCVNPSHLEPVTPRTNKIRAGGERCPNGHEYASRGYVSTSGERVCRACRTSRVRRYRSKLAGGAIP